MKQRGFTLIELFIVLAILAILASIVAPLFTGLHATTSLTEPEVFTGDVLITLFMSIVVVGFIGIMYVIRKQKLNESNKRLEQRLNELSVRSQVRKRSMAAASSNTPPPSKPYVAPTKTATHVTPSRMAASYASPTPQPQSSFSNSSPDLLTTMLALDSLSHHSTSRPSYQSFSDDTERSSAPTYRNESVKTESDPEPSKSSYSSSYSSSSSSDSGSSYSSSYSSSSSSDYSSSSSSSDYSSSSSSSD